MAGTILSHQVKFFASSAPKPAARHSERSEESFFFTGNQFKRDSSLRSE
jgi:hypothetical protein